MSSPTQQAVVEPQTPKRPYFYFILVYVGGFFFAGVTPLIYLLAFLSGSRPALDSIANTFSDPNVSVVITLVQWLVFFAVFYLIGKRVDFRKDFGNLGILTYGGILTSYFVFQLWNQAAGGGGGFSSLLLRQEIAYVVSAVEGFGLLFGAMSLAFLRTQLPFSDTPPLELMAYRNPAWAGLIALLTSFASLVLSAFIAALLFQEGAFRQDQFSFLNYYFSTGDPLFVNFIIYPALFMLLLYYIGSKIDFHRELRRVAWYLFTGGFAGYAVGRPLGSYLKVFFNPPSRASPSQISQLYAINAQSIIASALVAALLMFLGISVLTIALLLRRSDVPTEDEGNEGGNEEPMEEGRDAES